MKTNLLKSIFISLILLVGATSAWGNVVSQPKIYYNNTNTSYTNIAFMVGHSSYSRAYKLTKIADTNLWYRHLKNTGNDYWGDATQIAIFGVNWDTSEGSSIANRSSYTGGNYTSTRTLNANTGSCNSLDADNTYYVTADGNKKTTYIYYKSAGYNGIQKYDATQSAKVRNTTSGAYSEASGNWPATLKLQGTYLSGDGASGRSEISSTKSSDGDGKKVYGAVVTGKITHSYSDLSEDYQFDGWGTSTPAAGNTYEYHITANTTVYAFFTKKYAVNFGVHSSGGGTISAKSGSTTLKTGNKIVGGSQVVFTASPSKGYQVEGWYSDANCTSKIEAAGTNTIYTLTALESTAYVYVKFKGVQYTVTLNQENATTAGDASVQATYASAMPSATMPTRNGYDFAGYFDAKSGGTKYYDADGSSAKNWDKTAATTLYAQWTAKDITINWNANGGSVTQTSSTYTYDADAITLPTPSYAGHRFLGWFTAADGGTQITDVGTTNKPYTTVTYYAHWEVSIVEHEVTFGVGTGYTSYGTLTAATSSGNISSGANIVEGTSVTFTATPQTGYVVEGWYTDAACAAGKHDAGQTTYTTSITGITNVYVKFVEKTWSVAFTAGTGGTVSPSGIQTVGQVTGIIINANHDNGYTFNKWTITSGNGTLTDANSASTTFKPTSDATVEASFNETLSTLTTSNKYDAGNPSYAVPSATVSEIGIATTATVKATAAGNGYTFTGWTLTNCTRTDGGADNATSITVRSSGDGNAATVVANYAEDLTTSWVLKGSFVDDFATAYKFVKKSGESTGKVAYVSLDLADSKAYRFKVVNGSTWYGNNNSDENWWIKATAENWEFHSDAGNCHMKSSVAGTYTFKIDFSGTNPKVSVYFPTAYKITYGVGTNKGTDKVTTTPSITSESLVLASTSITFSKGDTKAGYTWKNWNSKADGTGTNLGTGDTYVSTSRAGDISVYACYDLIPYNITYNTNGGTNPNNAQTSYNVTTATFNLPTPTKTGYTFAGWYDNTNLTGNEVTQIAKGSTGDKAFWAKWTPITYTINYELGEGGTNHKDNPATYTIETATTELQDATPNAGYLFGGWYSDSEYANQVTQVAGGTTGNITLYAKWSAKAYTVNFDNNGGDGNTTPVTVAMGDPMPDVEIPTLHGYDFGGYWKDETQYYNADGTNAKNWDIDANDVILVAKWTAHPYTITYHLDGGTGASNTTYTIESAEITLPKPTKQYNAFAGWYDNSDFNGEAITTIASGSTGDKEFWAKWNIGTYAVTLDMEGGNGGTASVNVAYGAAMPTITIPTKNDYLFDGYYDGDNGTGHKYYNADGTSAKNWNKETATLYAKWIPYTKCIFFKNNLKWANVYVYTFKDNVWYDYEDANTKYGPGVCTKTTNNLEFAKMTKIGNTDIYYYALTSETGFCHIAFSDVAMNNWNEFYGGNAVYRADRYDQLPLFVPQTDQTPSTTNSTKYYSTGIWMKYNSTYSGYDWSGKTGNEAWGNHNLTAQDAGGFSFTTTVNLNAGTTYEFKISNIGRDAKNDAIVGSAWYGRTGTTFTPSKHSDITFYTNNENAKITPTVDGQYTFTVYLGDGKVVVSLDYPLLPGDYRLVYKDNTANSAHASHYIKKVSEQASKTESFFVRKDQNAQLFIQKCTAINSGVPAWETIANTTIYINNLIESTGVYNFEFTQNGEAVAITQKAEPYTGSYYIRTDAAAGGWNTFRQDGNKMTYSSYAERNSGLFNHYFCKWVENKKDGEGNDIHTNVKFVIANDYSYCVSDTLDGDEVINDGQRIGFLPQSANVRFGWDSRTNQVSRAYISGSSAVSDRFLVLKGDENLTDLNGDNFNIAELNPHETTFEDMGNWVYQLDVKAGRGTNIQLTARYNGKDQSFFSTSGASLIDATTPQSYKVRFIYDFKTNHLVAAWLLDDIQTSNGAELNSNMLVIRKHHDQAQQLKLNNALTNVGTAYGVMTFDKYFLNNRYSEGANIGKELPENERKSIYERALYWVSFPFDVCIRDVFGFGEYMDTWIMEYYDGEARAMNGAWVDSESYWTYITDLDYVLEAGVGYVLCLDLDKMGYESSVWAHTAEVSLYFPSAQTIGTINANQVVPVTLTQLPCSIERDNRKIYDSNWHVIGVPRFINLDLQLPEYSSIGQEGVLYYYKYNATDNTYSVAESGTETFQVMQAYMVQYAGRIDWTEESQAPAQIAARRNADAGAEKVSLNLELAQDDLTADKTFIQLQEEGATADFDMNIDLTKIINSGANIYTLTGEGNILTAGNVMPMSECVVPVGVKVDTEGEYAFRMPDGTEGMVVELIDYYTNTRTNLLPYDYTVNLSAGTCNDRFALHIQPSKSGVTTNIDQLTGSDLNAEGVQKYIIDGKLIIRTAEGEVFDAQGHRL